MRLADNFLDRLNSLSIDRYDISVFPACNENVVFEGYSRVQALFVAVLLLPIVPVSLIKFVFTSLRFTAMSFYAVFASGRDSQHAPVVLQ